MTVPRAINNINFFNTINIDEKSFAPKKYRNKNLKSSTKLQMKETSFF